MYLSSLNEIIHVPSRLLACIEDHPVKMLNFVSTSVQPDTAYYTTIFFSLAVIIIKSAGFVVRKRILCHRISLIIAQCG